MRTHFTFRNLPCAPIPKPLHEKIATHLKATPLLCVTNSKYKLCLKTKGAFKIVLENILQDQFKVLKIIFPGRLSSTPSPSSLHSPVLESRSDHRSSSQSLLSASSDGIPV